MVKRRKIQLFAAISLVVCIGISVQLFAEVNLSTLLPFKSNPEKDVNEAPVFEAPDSISELPVFSTLVGNNVRIKKAPASAILYEDFEGTTGYNLPNGWTTIATPGHPESKWISATLSYSTGEPFPGTSGTRYAFVEGQAYAIDTWLFSPAIRMEAGKLYDIFFNCFKPRPDRGGLPDIRAYITTDTSGSPESIVAELAQRDDAINSWEIIGRDFKPVETGNYYLAFENRVAVNGNYICIDDIYVTESTPRYYSETSLTLPDKTDAVASASGSFAIYNIGSSPLEVNVVETSPGLSTDALSYNVEPNGRVTPIVTVTSTTPGVYEGTITLRTNDPLMDVVYINVTCNVIKTHTSNYIFEDFEDGTPLGWGLNNFHFRNSDGVNKSRCLEAWSLYEPSVTTNIVEMGDNPILAFSYKATEYDYTGTQENKTPKNGDYVKFTLEVSDNGGNTWKQFYRIAPDGDRGHEKSGEFTRLEIPMPQYANKSCLIRLKCDMCTELFVDDFGILIDDWEMGTRPGMDLAASQLNTDGILIAGNKSDISVTIRNTSNDNISGTDYTVGIYDETGNSLASTVGSDLKSHEEKTFTLSYTPSVAGKLSITGKVTLKGDTKAENDATPFRKLIVIDNATSNIVSPTVNESELLYGYQTPIDFYKKYSATQTIYPVTEMNATMGVIRGVRYFFSNDAPFVTPEIEVYIGETNKFNFSDNKFVDPKTLTKVFSGSLSLPKGKTHFDIPFDETYEWNGGNIVVFTVMDAPNNYWNKLFLMSDDNKFKARTINNHDGSSFSNISEINDGVAVNVTSIAEFFIDVNSEIGSVTGVITDSKGAIRNAYVGYEGSSHFTTTDAQGHYTLNNVPVGDRKLVVKAFAHFDYSHDLTVTKGGISTVNATLKEYPSHDMTVFVVDKDKNPLSNVNVCLNGFENLRSLTSTDGKATFKVYDNQAYSYTIREYGKVPAYGKISGTTKEVTLHKDFMPVSYLKATSNNDKINVSWQSPKDCFRYDNGICNSVIGYNLGTYTSALGCAFHNMADIEEVEWFTNSEYTPHPYIYLYLFELDKNGRPDGIPVLAYRDVPNKDGQWNSFKLTQTMHSENGFFVGIACDAGSVGLGLSDLRDGIDLQPAWFWTSIDFTYEGENPEDTGLWADNYGTVNDKYVPMIRATGTHKEFVDYADYSPVMVDWTNNIKSVAKSNDAEKVVYRVEVDGKEVADNLSETSIELADLTKGKHTISVYAVYPDGRSIAKTAVIDTTSGIENVTVEDDVTVMAENGIIRIYGSENVSTYRLVDLTGKTLTSGTLADDVISVADFAKGIVILQLQLNDGSVRTFKLLI